MGIPYFVCIIFQAYYIQPFSVLFLLLTACFGLERPSSGALFTSQLSHSIKRIKCSRIYTLANVMFLV
jgi:hypothetical protein